MIAKQIENPSAIYAMSAELDDEGSYVIRVVVRRKNFSDRPTFDGVQEIARQVQQLVLLEDAKFKKTRKKWFRR